MGVMAERQEAPQEKEVVPAVLFEAEKLREQRELDAAMKLVVKAKGE